VNVGIFVHIHHIHNPYMKGWDKISKHGSHTFAKLIAAACFSRVRT